MNPTNGMNNPIATGALAFSMTDLVTTVQWLLPSSVPPATVSLVVSLLVAGVHYGLNWLATRPVAKPAAIPSAPVQS